MKSERKVNSEKLKYKLKLNMEEEEKKTIIVSARSNTNPLGNHKKNKGGIKPGVPDDDNLSSEENEDDLSEQDAG
jgi:hypothetical protein